MGEEDTWWISSGIVCLGTILNNRNFSYIFILGDFNADPFMSRTWEDLTNLCQRNHVLYQFLTLSMLILLLLYLTTTRAVSGWEEIQMMLRE